MTEKFGRLTPFPFTERSGGVTKRLYLCDCGTDKMIAEHAVKAGRTRSCGCYRRDHHGSITHGGTGTRLHEMWRGMVNRCHQSTKGDKFEKYRARGIAVCPEWRADFETFRTWALANGYDDTLTIERNDNDGNYEPGNCRFVTWKKQANNRRNSRFETIDGVTKTLTEWCEHYAIDVPAVQGRLRLGWPILDALTRPKQGRRPPP